jgi:hypothetical protein
MEFAWIKKLSTAKTPSIPLEERVHLLETTVRTLCLEWEDTHERVLRAMRRMNKRAQDQQERDQRESEKAAQEAAGDTNEQFPGVDPISAKILARRARVPTRVDGAG